MNIISTTDRHGKRRVTVELEAGEELLAVKSGSHYRLGHPVEDVVTGNIISECTPVMWCVVTQKWVD